MDPTKLSSKIRGRSMLPLYDGMVIEIPFSNCTVSKSVYNGYVRLDLSNAEGNKGDLIAIHNFIQSDFSPLRFAADGNWSEIVCKISSAIWRTPVGVRTGERYLNIGDNVSVVFTVKSFAEFGLFLTIKEICLLNT